MITDPERFLERSKWKNLRNCAYFSKKKRLNGVKSKLTLADVYTSVF